MVKRRIILFGYEGVNLLGQIRTYGEMGFSPTVIIVANKERPFFVVKSRYIGALHVVCNNEEGLSFILKHYSNDAEKPVLSTDSDSVVALLDKNYNLLKDKFLFYNAAKQGKLTPYLNKNFLCKAAERYGLNYPKSELVRIGERPKSINYPIFTKSVDSMSKNWKSNAFICKNETELFEAYSHMSGEEILLQEYVQKKNEFLFEGLSINNGEDVFIPVEGSYYRVLPLSYSQYAYYKESTELKLIDPLKKLFKEIGYNGIFEVEFLISDKNEFLFLEINFRQTAFNHMLTKMGICLEKIWIESTVMGELNVDEIKIKKQPWNLMNGINDFIGSVVHGNVSVFQWFKDVRNVDGFLVYDKKDIKPFFAYAHHFFKRALRSLLKKNKHDVN